METAKDALRNLGKALLGWLLSCAGAFLFFWLQFAGSEMTDVSTGGSGFLPSWYWDVNMINFTLGAVLSIVCLTAVWMLLLRGTLRTAFTQKKRWIVLWFALMLLALFAKFMLFFIGMWLTIQFLDTPYPEWTFGFIFVYIGYALLLAVSEIIRAVRRK